MKREPSRAIVVVVALVVLGWLAIQERNVRLQARGVQAAQARDLERAEESFRAARLLSPDPLPELRLALLYQGSAREDDARAMLERILAREPENLSAWGLLLTWTRGRDPAAVRRALAARQRLDPLRAG